MKNLCVPFKGFTKDKITQNWSESHQAFDIYNGNKSYGTWLLAMENCIVENIMGVDILGDNGWEYQRGFGILLRSITNPEIKYSYWHTLPFFPVKKNDIVLQGQPICQMGNSGFCISSGVEVKYEDKKKPLFAGTHCHLSCPKDTMDKIDFTIPIKFDLITTVSLTVQNMIYFLKNNIK